MLKNTAYVGYRWLVEVIPVMRKQRKSQGKVYSFYDEDAALDCYDEKKLNNADVKLWVETHATLMEEVKRETAKRKRGRPKKRRRRKKHTIDRTDWDKFFAKVDEELGLEPEEDDDDD